MPNKRTGQQIGLFTCALNFTWAKVGNASED